jgi:hypothetical protein
MPEPAHEKHDKHDAHRRLIARLREHAGEVRRLVSGLDEAAFTKRIKPDQWSLKEMVCHLDRVQQIFGGRVETMVAEENPAIAVWEPDGDPEFDKMTMRSGNDSLTAFLAGRERFAQRLEVLSPAEWHRPGRHPEFPHYDVHFQVEYMAHHEAHHIYQMYQRRVPFGKLPH